MAAATYLGDGTDSTEPLYSARASFRCAGQWNVEALVQGLGTQGSASGAVHVRSERFGPVIGQPVPPTMNPTLADTPIEQLTSQRPPRDNSFYELAVLEGLQTGKPLVVVITTPAFCQT